MILRYNAQMHMFWTQGWSTLSETQEWLKAQGWSYEDSLDIINNSISEECDND